MGVWGTGILANDTSADIKDTFFDLYDKGHDPVEIRNKIERHFKEGKDLEQNTDLWLTLALIQWQIGQVDKDVKAKAETIIDEEIDLKVWQQLDADAATIKRRKAALIKLKQTLQSDNQKPRKRKKKSVPRTIFKKGECYAFALNNGNYTAIVVLEDKKSEYTLNLIANTTINQPGIPTVEDIKNADILLFPPFQGDKKPYREAIAVYMNVQYQKVIKNFIKVGEIDIQREYDDEYLRWAMYSPWIHIIEEANRFLVDGKEVPKQRISLKEYIEKESKSNQSK